MALADAKRELELAANELTRLFQQELTSQGLVDSGKLRDSVKWVVITTPQGFTLRMEALDYFKFLDDKYRITDNVLRGVGYERVQEQIANAYNYIILDDLDKI
jgi:hypothetical protein